MVENYRFRGSVGEREVKLPKPTEDLVYFNKNGVELTRNSESENGNYFFFLKDITIDYTPVARIIGKLEKTQDGEVLKITQIDQLPGRRGALILALNKVPDLPIRDVLIEHFGISDNELDNAKQLYENGSNAVERRTDFDVDSKELRIEAHLRQTPRLPNIMAENDLVSATVKELEALCKVLGIPIASSIKELNSDSIVIFASKHDHYNTEPKELKEILLKKLNSDKKTILGLEFYSDKYFVDVLNDPTKNLNDDTLNELLSLMPFGKTVGGLIEVFNEIQHKYSRDRFEIKPFDVTYAESLEKLAYAIRGDKEKEYDEKRAAKVVENILDLLKTYGDKVFYTGMFHVIDLLTKLREIMESGNNEEINNIINKIVVFVPHEERIRADHIV